MHWCPKCFEAYQPDISRCAGCDVDLVPERPPQADTRWVKLADASPPRALTLRTLLTEAGIESQIQGTEVRVPAHQLAQARIVLAKTTEHTPARRPEPAGPPTLGPAGEASRIGWMSVFGFLLPPVGLFALGACIHWMRKHGDQPDPPGRGTIRLSFVTCLFSLLAWSLFLVLVLR